MRVSELVSPQRSRRTGEPRDCLLIMGKAVRNGWCRCLNPGRAGACGMAGAARQRPEKASKHSQQATRVDLPLFLSRGSKRIPEPPPVLSYNSRKSRLPAGVEPSRVYAPTSRLRHAFCHPSVGQRAPILN